MHTLILTFILLLMVIPLAFAQISDRTGLKQDFTIETGGNIYRVDVTSNFNVEKVEFNGNDKRLTFYINSGLENNLAEIQIPKNLINGSFTFMLNDQELSPMVKTSEKISFITIEFQGAGKNKLDIIQTAYVAESSQNSYWVLFVPIGVIIIISIAVIIFAKTKKFRNYSFNKD